MISKQQNLISGQTNLPQNLYSVLAQAPSLIPLLHSIAETRIFVDPYIVGSFKNTTGNKSVIHARYYSKCCLLHDNMLMSTTSINQLLACTSMKHKLFCHLAHVLLEHLKERMSMQWWCVTQTINQGGPKKEDPHVEADTFIPLHVLLSIQECILQEKHDWSQDKHKCIFCSWT